MSEAFPPAALEAVGVTKVFPGVVANAGVDLALRRGIGMTPGKLYSPSGRYTRHLRLSGCYPFSDRHVHALMTLGELAGAQLR